jgi:hypothetical protein
VQRADEAGPAIRRIEPVRLFERLRVERDDGIDARSVLVVRLDSIEVELDELPYRQRSRLVAAVDLRDRRLHDVEGRLTHHVGRQNSE